MWRTCMCVCVCVCISVTLGRTVEVPCAELTECQRSASEEPVASASGRVRNDARVKIQSWCDVFPVHTLLARLLC